MRTSTLWLLLLPMLAAGFAQPAAAQTALQYERAREAMVAEVIVGGGITNERVIRAMRDTPRHEFVEPKYRKQAYFDMALPIGDSQTISSPFIVAYMTQAIDPQPDDKVLEIGTGSGFQAAVLSPLVKEVYSIEIVANLGNKATQTLRRLKYQNVFTLIGDGYKGWPEHAPFDKIIVTCSPEKVPQPLIDQLREGGRMVIPVGERYQQILYLFTKKGKELVAEKLLPTLFVPMTGAAEENRKVKPDPLRPQAINGNFEEVAENGKSIPGWYYQQQWAHEQDGAAPEGQRFLSFSNVSAGRAASALQGLAVDGRKIGALHVTFWVRHRVTGPSDDGTLPSLAFSFYDEQRRDVGRGFAGPFRGDSDWKKIDTKIPVPATAREAILRIGLFGATGDIAFDGIKVEPVAR